MTITLEHQGRTYLCDLSRPIHISHIINQGDKNPRCFYAPLAAFDPVIYDGKPISTSAGAPVNFYNITINPHGTTTHTETISHISNEWIPIEGVFSKYHFMAHLCTIALTNGLKGDVCIDREDLEAIKTCMDIEVLIIRTLPNDNDKSSKDYSGKNPPYFTERAMKFIAESQVKHLIIDLPSVDKEEDGGALLAHKIYWHIDNNNPKKYKTISELAYIPSVYPDGLYLCHFGIMRLSLDVSPSNITLYPVRSVDNIQL